MKKLFFLLAVMLLSGMASAEPPLVIKGLKPGAANGQGTPLKSRAPGRSHLVVQFAHNPSDREIGELEQRGAMVLSYVPDFAFSISIRSGASLDGLGIRRIHQMRADEKISAALEGVPAARFPGAALVEFYPDVDPAEGRAIVSDAGLRIIENPDLLPRHVLVRGSREQILALASWDEVSYVFPASQDLLEGVPVHACAGAMTAHGTVSQAIPLIGDGWDGPGLGSTSLNYAFVNETEQLPADEVQAQIVNAFSQWANVVQVTFSPGDNTAGNQTIAVLFATGDHGDGYPFVGTSVLAHTFYPYPVDPEPIAGDMHFNDAQTWQIGTGTDLYSVALHETGHALGLGHSDVPGDVMYPYYRIHTTLMPDDIAAAQELYAAVDTGSGSSPSPTPSPVPNPDPAPPQASALSIAVVAPASSTASSSISISGTTSGGSGTVSVRWSNGSASGVAQGSSNWVIPTVPLNLGANVITITAQDSQNDVASTSVTVNCQPPSSNPPPNPNPAPNPSPNPAPNPGQPDTTPPSLTILSPATTNYTTTSSSIVISGTATDNVGVASVTWATSNGTSGTANGTTNWSTAAIPLYEGTTTIVITAADTAGNTSWRSITVTLN